MYTQHMTPFFGNMAALEAGSEAAGEVMKKQMAMIGFQMMAAYEKLLKQGLEFKVLVGENPKLLAPAYPGMQTGLFVKNFLPIQLGLCCLHPCVSTSAAAR